MAVQLLNPRNDPAWDALLLRSGDNSFFHTAGWARVLEESYGFKPLYIARSEGGQLSLLMPMMEVPSLFRGRRGVCLPFTDRCAPLALEPGTVVDAVRESIDYGKKQGWRSIEWRDDNFGPLGASASNTYLTHEITLRKSETELFGGLRAGNRRNVRKALRGGVSVRIERSEKALKSFYRLNCLTRKRHGLPPQPYIFFKKVHEYIFSLDLGRIFSAHFAGRVIAAAVFFNFGNEALFKYGASEMDRRRLRPNNLIMWEALKWHNQRDFARLSLGRTEPRDLGLLRYKRAWGGEERPLRYFRYDLGKDDYLSGLPTEGDSLRHLLSKTPSWISRILGRLFYRHFG